MASINPISEFLVRVCCPCLVLQILTQFQTKIGQKPYPFSDLTSKIPTRLQTWYIALYHIEWLKMKRDTLVVRIKNHSQDNPFSDQNSSKAIPFGVAHTYIAKWLPIVWGFIKQLFDNMPLKEQAILHMKELFPVRNP